MKFEKAQMKNEYLRHTLSTIAYRFHKSVKSADEDFGEFKVGKETRSPNEIISHMFHVLNAARIFILTEKTAREKPKILLLRLEIERFNLELHRIDNVLAEKELGIEYSKRLLQGPFSDILTHIGQISMLSRLNDNPIAGEEFSAAPIKAGKFSFFKNENIKE